MGIFFLVTFKRKYVVTGVFKSCDNEIDKELCGSMNISLTFIMSLVFHQGNCDPLNAILRGFSGLQVVGVFYYEMDCVN